MAKVVLMKVGTNKIKIIKIFRDLTGLGLVEAKNIIDNIETGGEYTFSNLSESEKNNIISIFTTEGATAIGESESGDDFRLAVENVNLLIDQEKDVQINEKAQSVSKQDKIKYCPPVAAEFIHKLDRNETMSILIEVGKIAKASEKLEMDIALYGKKVVEERNKGESLRKSISIRAKTIKWVVIIISLLVGIFTAGIGGLIAAVVAYIVMNMTVIKSDLKKHADENNANADAYILNYVNPLQEKLDKAYKQRELLISSGKRAWAISVVGKDIFYSKCIDDLYTLINSHRADNLKEALNLYDDSLYKNRMEEMQAAIRNASEIAAVEALKQTALSEEVTKNTRQAADAAVATAAYTRTIEKNTRGLRRWE